MVISKELVPNTNVVRSGKTQFPVMLRSQNSDHLNYVDIILTVPNNPALAVIVDKNPYIDGTNLGGPVNPHPISNYTITPYNGSANQYRITFNGGTTGYVDARTDLQIAMISLMPLTVPSGNYFFDFDRGYPLTMVKNNSVNIPDLTFGQGTYSNGAKYKKGTMTLQ